MSVPWKSKLAGSRNERNVRYCRKIKNNSVVLIKQGTKTITHPTCMSTFSFRFNSCLEILPPVLFVFRGWDCGEIHQMQDGEPIKGGCCMKQGRVIESVRYLYTLGHGLRSVCMVTCDTFCDMPDHFS